MSNPYPFGQPIHFSFQTGEDKDIILWDLATSKKITKLQVQIPNCFYFLQFPKGHTDTVWDLDFCASGNVLASGGADQTVRLWDIKMVREDIHRAEQADKHEEQLRMELETDSGDGNQDDPHHPSRKRLRHSKQQDDEEKYVFVCLFIYLFF